MRVLPEESKILLSGYGPAVCHTEDLTARHLFS